LLLCGSGAYIDSYILKWDGQKIVKADVVDTKNKKELSEMFLKDGESFGPGGLGYITICSGNDGWCNFKQGAPNAVGQVVKKFKYQNGKFTALSYRRKNY